MDKVINKNTSEVKSLIIELVNEYGPIKQTHLVSKLLTVIYGELSDRIDIKDIDVIEIIEPCCKDKEIINLSYTLPDSEYRCRSILFPKGANITVEI